MLGELGSQVADIARTQGQIMALTAGKAELAKKGIVEPDKDAPKETWEAYNLALTNSTAYQAAQAKYGTGSAIQKGIQAATAAVQGLAGGNLAQALAGASAPYLAEVIHKMTTDPVTGKVNTEANAMAHAVLGALTAYAGGNNALAGAAGAVTAELMAPAIIAAMGWDKNTLTEDQRQTVNTLSTLAAGLAGGVVGDSTSDAIAGAQTGQNAVSNNYLSSTEKSRQTELNHKQELTPQEQQERDALNKKDAETSKILMDACLGGDAASCATARNDALEKQATYQNLGYQNSKEMQAGYQQIQSLLNGTSAEALQTQAIFNGMVDSYVRMGMSEADAKAAVGYQLGSMYVVGGIVGIGAGKAVEEGLVPGTKTAENTNTGNGTAQTGGNSSNGAESSASGLNLNKSLASEAQLADLVANGGKSVAGVGSDRELRDAPRLVAEYGGNASDWSKVTSESYKAADGLFLKFMLIVM